LAGRVIDPIMTDAKKLLDKKEIIGRCALFLERYLFPVFFGYFAFGRFALIYRLAPGLPVLLQRIVSGGSPTTDIYFLARFLSDLFLGIFKAMVMVSLLMPRKVYRKPESFQDIFVPVLATLFYLFYAPINNLSPRINFVMLPKAAIIPAALIGSLIALAGCIISMLAAFSLRRSYAVFVEVRETVFHGLYQYVRHPIYFGYILIWGGLFLASPRFLFLVLNLLGAWILIYRARLEESKLADVFPDYRRYMAKTPFLLPFSAKLLAVLPAWVRKLLG